MRPKTRPITSRRSRPGTRQTGAQLHPKVRQRKQKAFAFATLSKAIHIQPSELKTEIQDIQIDQEKKRGRRMTKNDEK